MKLKEGRLKKVDWYDLDQEIMKVWSVADDIDVLFEHFYENHESMTVDDMANLLLGLKHMLHIKCEKLYNTYEMVLKNENSQKSFTAS